MTPMRLQIRAALALPLLVAALARADPGNEEILDSTDATVRLYLFEVHRAPDGSVTGLGVAWLPKDIEQRCLGLSLRGCRELDRQAARDPKRRPSRPLGELVTEPSLREELARRWALKPGRPGVETLEKLSRAISAKARVRWELWSNGENFAVRKALK